MTLPRIQISIVENLKKLSKLTDQQLEAILRFPEEMSLEAMEKHLRETYKISEFEILASKSLAFGFSPYNVNNAVIDEQLFVYLNRKFCVENNVLPVGAVGSFLIVAVVNPFNLQITQKIEDLSGKKPILVLGIENDILNRLHDKAIHTDSAALSNVLGVLGEQFGNFDEELLEESISEEDVESQNSAPIIQLANLIIEDAFFSGASDIHIEPFEKTARVRVRVDGVCREKLTVSRKVCMALLTRLKIMANIDISERRLPQDGRIVFKQFTTKNIDVDLRVSTAPLNFGEGCVMRILDKTKSTLGLEELGFETHNLESYRKHIEQPYGIILHCGPTGSGKSMTLYSALNEINNPSLCIRTIEDPIEYTLPGLCQVQMQRKIGLTFASVLHSFLRQDPDVILVGEIRDKETASIALEAALTGHLIFSTLHTNDAPSAVVRLTNMGIEPFILSASLLCVCAQRLIRRLCKSCKEQYAPEKREAEILEKAIHWSGPIYKSNPNGCPNCGNSGYKGRIGIHELMSISDPLIAGINQQLATMAIKQIAIANGMKSLHQDSMYKVRAGVTSMDQALAIVIPDSEDAMSRQSR